MDFLGLEIDKIEVRLRYKVRYELGFACADVDDVVQESLRRFLDSVEAGKIRSPEAAGAFLNGICRNVIAEYRRRLFRDVPMPETIPEPAPKAIHASELFELREAIEEGMKQLSLRDQQILRAFYLEERPVEEILEITGLTLDNFRVVLCRAKERFRRIYNSSVQSRAASKH